MEGKVNKVLEVIAFMSHTIDDFRSYFRQDREKTEFTLKDAVSKTLDIIGPNFKFNIINVKLMWMKNLK